MTQENVQLADRLKVARDTQTKLTPDDTELAPDAFETAYNVQALLNGPTNLLAGWKVGCANLTQQAMLGVSEPFFGGVLAEDALPSGVNIPAQRYVPALIEPELGFALAPSVTQLSGEVNLDNLSDYISALHPVFEIFNPRIDPPFAAGAAPLIADRGGNGALIIGPACAPPAWQDLAHTAVSLSVNEEVIETGSGENVLGNPVHSAIWFLNTALKRGLNLAAGQIIATGSFTKPYPAKPGDRISATYADFGEISLSISH